MFHTYEGPTADRVWQELVRVFRAGEDVRIQPSRGGPTKEILHVATSVTDPRQRWVVSRQPPMNIAFAIAEVVWVMTGRNDLSFLEAWNSSLHKFVGRGPVLHGAYGHRLRQHLGIDQLGRAYEALSENSDTRQVVLQIWDASSDFPDSLGNPADPDIPCNIVSMLKVREGKLEWLQVIRSNDLFLGVPYNIVQFTCLQEIIAGWLGVECGAYHQVSDSLHLYERDEANVFISDAIEKVPTNSDSLMLPREESDLVFKEMASNIEQMIRLDLTRPNLERLSEWGGGPEAYRNMFSVLVAEMARRRGWTDLSYKSMSTCSNAVYVEMWDRWRVRASR